MLTYHKLANLTLSHYTDTSQTAVKLAALQRTNSSTQLMLSPGHIQSGIPMLEAWSPLTTTPNGSVPYDNFSRTAHELQHTFNSSNESVVNSEDPLLYEIEQDN